MEHVTRGTGACLALVLLLAGCTGPAPATAEWSRVELPAGTAPSLLVPGPEGSLLVAIDAAADGSPGPRLLRVADGRVDQVPVRASTYYGQRTLWRGLVAYDGRLVAFGGRSGGAHGNPRWTTWSGRGALREDPQPFTTFGGTRGGSLTGVVATPGGPVLVGSRVSEDVPGLDVVLWDLVGRRWTQRSSAGTALAADAETQPSAHAATSGPGGVVVAGSLTGGSRTRPVVWLGAERRVDLPAGDAVVAEADAVACDGDCLVPGVADGRLVGWWVAPDGTVRPARLPAVRAEGALVALDGSAVVAAGRQVLVEDGDGWTRTTAPGPVTGVAVTGAARWVATARGLWRVRTP